MKTSLEEMQAFVSVVDSGSFSAAAEQLQQTASGISRALSRLEDKLAVTLLRRTTRRLELTEEGEVFLAQARRILASVEQAEEQMALRRQAPAGRLRVNTAAPFMLHVIVPLIGDFRARYPQIELELYSDDRIIDLLERRTDLAIRLGPLPDSSLHARPLCHTLRRVLASPAYLARHGTPQQVEALADRLHRAGQPQRLATAARTGRKLADQPGAAGLQRRYRARAGAGRRRAGLPVGFHDRR